MQGTVISQTAADLLITRPVVLQKDSKVSQSPGDSAKTLSFASTIDDTSSGSYTLTVDGGASVVSFSEAVGSSAAQLPCP